MGCLYCGERLISKTPTGLNCCGCGRPVDQAHAKPSTPLSLRSLFAFSLAALAVGPLLVAMSATDQLRSGSLAAEVQGSEPESSEP